MHSFFLNIPGVSFEKSKPNKYDLLYIFSPSLLKHDIRNKSIVGNLSLLNYKEGIINLILLSGKSLKAGFIILEIT